MKKMILAAVVLAATSSAFAFSKSDLSNGSYGTAGCGLGSLAFGNKTGPIQIFAATLNGTAGSQTFGMSTGTSNCGPSVFAANETKAFIDNNAVALENDIVRGQGETLMTLSKMMSCDSQVLGTTLKNNYKSIYTGEQSTERVMETAQKVCSVKG
ncbi:DUF3015 family protein [Bdellovibrio sp. HCB290]|uniref:DUF3015 family protein n=1 Tax=Bdellovibrio sp. HCB290 TaxID=3394356 RepID=UPI0039B4F7CE